MSKKLSGFNIETKCGNVTLVWHPRTLLIEKIVLPDCAVPENIMLQKAPPKLLKPFVRAVLDISQQKQVKSLHLSLLNWSQCSTLQTQALKKLYALRPEQISYQELALACGKPQAARAIGTAMAQNPFPLIIPCHRVIKSDGELGQYQGGAQMKAYLLGLREDAPAASAA